MRSIKFDYLEYNGTKAPIIPVALKSNEGWRYTTAYVDSGASYSIFKVQEAERLGLNIRSGKKSFVVVGDGSCIPIYFFTLPVRIANIELTATISFSEKLGVGFNLLGRKDIFSVFDVTFSDTKESITFTKI